MKFMAIANIDALTRKEIVMKMAAIPGLRFALKSSSFRQNETLVRIHNPVVTEHGGSSGHPSKRVAVD
jgi:hypothetical protein